MAHSLKPYRKDEIDFLVAYVVPENAWYVFPMSEAEKHRSLKLYPGSQRKRSKVERYREAWEMLEFPGQKEKADHVSMIGL